MQPPLPFLLVVVVVVVVIAFVPPATATAHANLPQPPRPVPQHYLIELSLPPLAQSANLPSRHEPEVQAQAAVAISDQQSQFLAYSASKAIPIFERSRFSLLFNGFSVKIPSATPQILSQLAAAPMVQNISPLMYYERPHNPHNSTTNLVVSAIHQPHDALSQLPPLLSQTHSQTGVSILHSQNVTGSQTKIGIIDTGIDYTHPAFGSCRRVRDLGHCRVQYGYDFVGNSLTQDPDTVSPAKGRKSGALAHADDSYSDMIIAAPAIGDDPMDCAGHGTHVAGIAAGNYPPRLIGVAPSSIIGAYKVFGCHGGATSDAIIQALERAHHDGMDVVNLSIGGGSSWSGFPEARAAAALANTGVIVVAAQGNEGTEGLLMTSSPGVAPNIISVAATENTYYLGGKLSLTTAPQKSMYWAGSVNPPHSAPGLWKTPYLMAYEPLSMCDETGLLLRTKATYAQKVVMVQRGICAVAKKAKNVHMLGALGMILWNTDPDLLKFSLNLDESIIPVVGVSGKDGIFILKQIRKSSGTAKVVFDGPLRPFENPTAGNVAEFSSWGPGEIISDRLVVVASLTKLTSIGPSLEIKPNIAAPGALMFSSFLTSKGSYAVLSGTSMASPYIAGTTALLLSHPRRFNRLHLKPLLESSSTLSSASAPHKGSGLVNVSSAASSMALLSPTLLHLSDRVSPHRPYTTNITITSTSSTLIRYTVSHTASPALSAAKEPWILPPLQNTSYHAAIEIPSSITLHPNSSQTVHVSIILPPSRTPWYYSGVIVFAPVNSTASSLHTTYLGLSTPMHNLPIFPTNGTSPSLVQPSRNTTIPFIHIASAAAAAPKLPPISMNLTSAEWYISLNFLRPVYAASIYLIPTMPRFAFGEDAGRPVLLDRLRFVGRDSSKRHHMIGWDGMNTVVGGVYTLQVRVSLLPPVVGARAHKPQAWNSPLLKVQSRADPFEF
ncbi:hypothetical protein SeMB42_g07341 [Synchytrium endobioticum]|uniref:Peptidase S8/S53 domain-containing protein n=1 Tax=Synchytrium endobioticum TaxID=286115 RepID=A0A507CIZ7_9FUNG|nr:hypothetical protein SeMB42_g07341 [Synchytrium endobioticum]TPX39538.1 hypothetical protein SeLEV6574_g07134 [Synchytrium endobioticum]